MDIDSRPSKMVSIKSTRGYQICDTKYGGYFNLTKSLHASIVIWVNINLDILIYEGEVTWE